MNGLKAALLAGFVVLLTGMIGCGGADDVLDSSNAPEDHTNSQDGALHMDGLRDPVNNCTACHGDDLQGGEDGEPSCYSCHGDEWS